MRVPPAAERRIGTKAGVVHLPMLPFVAPAVRLGPEAVDDRKRLLEPVVALAQGRKRDTELVVLLLVPSGSHPQLDPSAAHFVGGGDHLGEVSRDAERDRRDEGSKPDSRRVARQTG